MLNSKYVSAKMIMENVLRDNPLFKDPVNFSDVLEWIWYAIGLIGAPTAYHDKVSTIDIVYHRGGLPCDLIDLRAVREYVTGTGMVVDHDLFYKMNREVALDNATSTDDGISTSLTGYSTGTFQVDHNGYPIIIDDVDYLRSIDANSTYFYTKRNYQSGYEYPYSYRLDENYIYTSFEDGKVEIAYKAFPTDRDGNPTIPDDVRYIKAVEAYIADRIARGLFMQDKLSILKYKMYEQEWLWYVGSAGNKSRMPSVDGMEAIKNSFLRAIPKINQHGAGMKYRTAPERLKTRR